MGSSGNSESEPLLDSIAGGGPKSATVDKATRGSAGWAQVCHGKGQLSRVWLDDRQPLFLHTWTLPQFASVQVPSL